MLDKPGLAFVWGLDMHLALFFTTNFMNTFLKIQDSPSRQRRRARRAASRKQQAEKAQVDEAKEANSNDLVKFQEMCSISLYTIFLMIKLQSENLDVENVEVLNQHSDDVQDGPIKPIYDEFCPDEDYHEVDNVDKTAFICHQCRMSFLPKNYK